MTLKNIPLAPIVIANLYKHSLVEIQNNEKKSVQQSADIIFLGDNKKHILLLVYNPDARFLPDQQLSFLSGILSACKLSMQDIAIVNLYKSEPLAGKKIPGILQSEIIIASGIELSLLDLPFKIPLFQIQSYSGKKYVFIPPLHIIENDAVQKRKLWELLKILFSV